MDVMKKTPLLLPKQIRQFEALGERLKLARLRRSLTAELVAERAGISRATLNKVEAGNPAVAMGNYYMVLKVLDLATDFDQLAARDDFGHSLFDIQLSTKNRAPKRKTLR